MRKGIFAGLLLSIVLVVASVTHAGDWPQWRGPDRNGIASNGPALLSAFPQGGLTKLWTSEPIGGDRQGGFGSVTVADGRAYVFVNRNYQEPITERKFDTRRLRRQGYDANMPVEFSKLVEAARLSEARTKLRGGREVRRWSIDWIKANSKAEWRRFEGAARSRLSAGPNAFPLELLVKLDVVKARTFANQAELDAWFGANGIDGETRRKIVRLVKTTTPKAADAVHCLSASTGKTLWKTDLPGNFLNWTGASTPTITDGRVYVVNSEATVCCLNVTNGKLLWKSESLGRRGNNHSRSSSALLADGVVVIATASNLAGLEAETGKVLWRQKAIANESSSAAAWRSGGKTYVLCNGSGKLGCVDIKTGEVVWSVRSRGTSTPTVVGQHMAFVGGDNNVGQTAYKLSTEQPEQLWNVPLKDAYTSPVIYRDHVYVIGEKGRALCIELAGGKVVWEQRIRPGTAELSSPIIADGKLITVAGPWLYLIKATPERFTPLGKANLGLTKWTSPAIADGKVFLRTGKAVVCYDLRKR